MNQLEDLLTALRALPLLRERSRGVFYWRAQAFIHFHEDPAGLYADLRVGAEFERYPVNTETERGLFWSAVQQALV